jgi:hypothetical protein
MKIQFVANSRQFAANLRQFALTPVSSLLTLVMSRPLPLSQGVGSPRPLPHQGGEGGSGVDPSGRSEFSATPSRTPRHLISPSLGSESGPAVQDGSAVLPAKPNLAPRGSAPSLTGRGLGAGWIRINSYLHFSIPPESGQARYLGLTCP